MSSEYDRQEEQRDPKDCLVQNCPLAGAHQNGDQWVCIYHLNAPTRHWGAVTYALNLKPKKIKLLHSSIRLEPNQFDTLIASKKFNIGKFNPQPQENYLAWRDRIQEMIHGQLKLAIKEAVETNASKSFSAGQTAMDKSIEAVMSGML